MPKIEFRGQTYNSEFEMPYDVRQAYIKEKERRGGRTRQGETSLSDLVEMSPEVKAIYERALGNVDDKLSSSPSTRELPNTEDIYRQSAPRDMQDLPCDESIYRPSPPPVGEMKPAIEPESGVRRLLHSIVWALIIVAIVFLAMQFLS